MGLVYVLATLLLAISGSVLLHQRKLRKLRRQRSGLGRQAFIEACNRPEVPPMIPATIFDYYSGKKGWRGFPFLPSDKYRDVLHDDPDDLDEDAVELVERLGLKMPPEYIRREYGETPIATLQDMILWLDWIRQHQPDTRPGP